MVVVMLLTQVFRVQYLICKTDFEDWYYYSFLIRYGLIYELSITHYNILLQ